jgi:hypothetical protein
MAHLRKKERWLDHALAMIEGKSLAKTAAPSPRRRSTLQALPEDSSATGSDLEP